MTAAPPQRAFDAAMRRRLAAAAAAIVTERAMARELGVVLSVWALYVAAAMAGIAERLPGEARLALLALLMIVSAALLARAAWRLGLPPISARRARLERGGGLPRGLLAIRDELPAGAPDALGDLLWARAQHAVCAARPRLGRSEWMPSAEARYGLIPLIGTALFLGAVASKAEAPKRIAAAFSPYAANLSGIRLTISLEAPEYAGALPRRIVIGGGERGEVTALAGGTAGFRVEGAADWYVLAPDGRIYPGINGRAAVPIATGGEYAVKAGRREIAALDVTIAADRPPLIRFDGAPAQTPSGALRLAFRLSDDYGQAALSLRLRRGKAEREVDLDLSVAQGRGHVFADLTPQPFAGSEVELRLAATDGAGQRGMSPPILLTLPERRFTNPLSREIIAVRKALLAGAGRDDVIRRLNAITAEPGRYEGDAAIYAGLRGAGWRLVHDRRRSARESTAALLWDIAADLEDGGASRAMDELRAAMERLSEGLQSGDDEALAAMAEQLEAAMSDYLRRQIEAALAEGGAPPDSSAGAGDVSVDLGFLDQMFADLKDRMAAGDTKGAAEALANLRQLMETIRFGGGAPDPEAAERAARAGELARQLRAVEARQGTLRDQTIAEMIRASFGSGDALRQSAGAQSDIERATGELERAFGSAGVKAPPELGTAEKAMAEAAEALAQGDAGAAIRAQTRALEALQQAGNAVEAAAERMAQMAGPGAMQPGAAGSGLDPLGRPGTGFGQGAVELPDQSEVRRIQAIRKILEERANDSSRSADERGYYLRLLKRF